MKELISKEKLLKDLNGMKDVLSAQGEPFLSAMLQRAIDCVNNQPVVLMGMDLASEDGNG